MGKGEGEVGNRNVGFGQNQKREVSGEGAINSIYNKLDEPPFVPAPERHPQAGSPAPGLDIAPPAALKRGAERVKLASRTTNAAAPRAGVGA